MKNLRFYSSLLVSALLGPQAMAEVRYDFTAHSSFPSGGYSYTGSFSVVVADFISGYAQILWPAMLTCSSSPSPVLQGCLGATFDSGPPSSGDSIAFRVRVLDPNAVYADVYYYFADGAFATPGTHASQILGPRQAATLVVSSISAVPEPAAAVLLIPGMLMLAAISRRRNATLRRLSLAG